MKYKIIMLTSIHFSLMLGASPAPTPQAIAQFVDKATAMQLYQKIDAIKIKTFSTNSFLRSGLNKEGLQEWKDLITAATHLVERESKGVSKYNKYKLYSHSMYLTLNEIEKIVDSLHTQYKGFYKKDADESKKPLLQVKRISTRQIKELENILRTIQNKINDMHEINAATFAQLLQNVPTPKSWSDQLYNKGKIKDAADFMPQYKKVLAQYRKEKDFNTFLKSQGITDTKSAERMINTLEQVIFVMKEKLTADPSLVKKIKASVTGPNKEREENVQTTQEIIDKLRKEFPQSMSTLQTTMFSMSDDKPSMILFAQSSALESVLNQLKREVTELYTAATNTSKK